MCRILIDQHQRPDNAVYTELIEAALAGDDHDRAVRLAATYQRRTLAAAAARSRG
jgi:hypothetical protein